MAKGVFCSVFSALCLLYLSSQGDASDCGKDNDPCEPTLPCELGQQVSNPADCNSFKECVAPYEFAVSTSECGDNKGVFSNQSCSCTSHNPCHTWTCPPKDSPPTLKESAPCLVEPMALCGDQYITIPDMFYCTKYFVCNNNVWTSAICPHDAPYYDVSIPYNHPPCSNNVARCNSIPFEECSENPDTTTTTTTTTTTSSTPSTASTTTSVDKPQVYEGVAFSVSRSADYGPVREDSAVPFDTVDVNHGGGFQKETSRFVVPISGLYIFMYSLNGAGVKAYLSVNGKSRAGIITPLTKGHMSPSSHSLVLDLTQGDQVWVALAAGARKVSACDGRYCTFSGYRLE